MDPQDVVSRVAEFLARNAKGWIKEQEAIMFLDSQCSLKDICIALALITDQGSLESLAAFLESVIVFESVALRLFDESLKVLLTQAVDSPSLRLRSIVVKGISVIRKKSFPREIDMSVLIHLFKDEDTGIGLQVHKIIVGWMRDLLQTDFERMDFLSRLLEYYRDTSVNETVQFRFLALFVEIGSISSNLFRALDDASVFAPLAHQYLASGSDILVKLASLSLLEGLAGFEDGQRYLARSNVLLALERELSGLLVDSTTVISLLHAIAGIVPYVTDLDLVRRILSPGSSAVPALLARFMTSTDNSERSCAMKILGQLSAGADSNAVIAEFLRMSWKSMNEIVFALSDIDVEVVNTALDSIHSMLKRWEVNPFMESTESQMKLTEAVLETFKRHPFPETRCLVYACVGAMVMNEEITESALAAILTDPSPIRRALLDFHSESTYDSRVAKVDLVRVLVRMEDKTVLRKYFSTEQVENFIDYSDKGLQYVPMTEARNEMATDAS